MLYLFLVAGLFLLPMLLRLAIRLRLGIPILYALGMLTVFHSWYQTHTALADGIFLCPGGAGRTVLVVTAARKICAWADERLAGGHGKAGQPSAAGRGQRRVRCQHRWAVVLRSARSHQLPDEPVASS